MSTVSAEDIRKQFPKEVAEIVLGLANRGATIRRTKLGHLQIRSSVNEEMMGVSRNSGSGHVPIHKVKQDAARLYPAEQTDKLSKSALRGFDKDCVSVILKAVNEYGWTYAWGGKGFIDLTAPDGSGKRLGFSPGSKPINPNLSALRRIILQHGVLSEPAAQEPAETLESITAGDTFQAAEAEETVTEAPEAEQTKVCSRCKEEKPANEFYKASRSKDGLQSYCKACSAKASTGRKTKGPEPVSEPAAEPAAGEPADARPQRPSPVKIYSKTKTPYDDVVKLQQIREILGEDPRVARLEAEAAEREQYVAQLEEELRTVNEEAAACRTRADELSSSLGALRELIAGIDTDGGAK